MTTVRPVVLDLYFSTGIWWFACSGTPIDQSTLHYNNHLVYQAKVILSYLKFNSAIQWPAQKAGITHLFWIKILLKTSAFEIQIFRIFLSFVCRYRYQYEGSGSGLVSEAISISQSLTEGIQLTLAQGCRTARLQRLAGRYYDPMPESTISPSQVLRIWSPNTSNHPEHKTGICER